MRIFESHCHLYERSYKADMDAVIRRAHDAGVQAIMVIGIDAPSSSRAVAIAQRYPGVFASVGIHPHDAKTCSQTDIEYLQGLAANGKVRAWGEIGLDFNRMYSPVENQERCFIRQLEAAARLDLPVIFHERDSRGRFLEILKQHWAPGRKGVVHCFSGDQNDLEAYLEMGLYIGVTGIVTMQQRGKALRRLVCRAPANRLLVETDAPYLTPAPERNKTRRNEPAFVRTVLNKLAAVRRQDPSELAAALWSNSCEFFRVSEEDISLQD